MFPKTVKLNSFELLAKTVFYYKMAKAKVEPITMTEKFYSGVILLFT